MEQKKTIMPLFVDTFPDLKVQTTHESMNIPGHNAESGKMDDWVKKNNKEKNLVWLDRVDFNNSYTLMMRKEQAEKLDITFINELAKNVGKNYITESRYSVDFFPKHDYLNRSPENGH